MHVADSMAPSAGQHVDAQGVVTYDFEGHVHANGLDLDSGSGFADPFNTITWERRADGAVVAQLYAFHDPGGDGAGQDHTANVILYGQGVGKVSNLSLAALNETTGIATSAGFYATASGAGGSPRRHTRVELETEIVGGPGSATILDSLGRSSFLRIAHDNPNLGAGPFGFRWRGHYSAAQWPPASPTFLDVAMLVAAPGDHWVFWLLLYDPNLAPYPWRFIGGCPAVSFVDNLETRANAAYGDLATVGPQLAIPVNGQYLVTSAAHTGSNVAGGYVYFAPKNGANPTADIDGIIHGGDVANMWKAVSRVDNAMLCNGGTTLKLQYRTDGAGVQGTWFRRTLRAVPVGLVG